jgi:hypothetical protein
MILSITKEMRPLGRPRPRRENNIKIDLKEILWDGVGWIDMFRNRDKWKFLFDTKLEKNALDNYNGVYTFYNNNNNNNNSPLGVAVSPH